MALNTSGKETYRERQETELEVLKSIYEKQVEDLRPPGGKWTEVRLKLTPRAAKEIYVRCDLHITCNKNYPKYPPKIQVENIVGLSDQLVEQELLEQLKKQADELKGEVMIYELAGIVEAFLHKYNVPPKGSFYDEMLATKQKQALDLQNTKKAEEDQRRQVVQDELQKRKKELERIRRESKHSISEASPIHRNTSSSENSAGEGFWNFCTEHRRSETLFLRGGRRILKGACLGHSQRGCIAYAGIDDQTGQLLYITEWTIELDDGKTPCGKLADEVVVDIEKQVACLATLKHKNLITYEGVLCNVGKNRIDIFLVQDFILGTSLFTISGTLGWSAEGASKVAKGVLEALIYLHNNGVSHDNLSDSTVFMDNAGCIRVADFKLIPYIQEISSGQQGVRGDLPALGTLVESLFNAHSEMKDFIDRCKSERTISASDLLEHPFLRPTLFQVIPQKLNKPTRDHKATDQPPTDRSQQSLIPAYMNTSLSTEKSRLQTEFEVMSFIGKGAYGDVLKVRNILDNRQYAIKRILLPARSKHFYKKMTREVELLSRLNHENVVRYYNSWVEAVSPGDEKYQGGESSCDWSLSAGSVGRKRVAAKVAKKTSEKNSDWVLDCMGIDSSSDDDDDDDDDDEDCSNSIEFVNSDGEVATYASFSEGVENEKGKNGGTGVAANANPEMLYMYIQMEFCEKSTLRTAIDSNLYLDVDRVWRLFREIAEGLSHIHQQGMIHRDLKPVNIFLDSRDQVKIGDFGLATTSILALQNQQQEHVAHQTKSLDMGNSLTGKVGTALYVAPELTGNASKSTYNQKVDLYSLGIILFEMSCTPLSTGMERVKTLMDLRSTAIQFPDHMLTENKYSQQIQVIRWLLNHDPSKRPSAEELLSSELVPPTRLEAGEIQDIVRHVMSNPQSRHYKHLIARCFAQESDMLCELSYHLDMVPIIPRFDFIKAKIIDLFRKHGAIEVVTPLLTPCTQASTRENSVKLMTHSGSIVSLPEDLRLPFLRHVALNGVRFIRRYSIGRVYREKKVFNFHPKQVYECAFDIVTPCRGNMVVDAELIAIANDILRELNLLDQKRNVFFRLNHTSLLKSILLYCNVPESKYRELFEIVMEYLENKISKFQLVGSVNSQISQPGVKINTGYLCDVLQISEISLDQLRGTQLKELFKGRGEAAMLAKMAQRDLESVVMLAQGMGVQCPMLVCPGLPINYERAKGGGLVWQLLGELKPKKRNPITTIAVGGRYDAKLVDFQKSGIENGLQVPKVELSGAGFSFHLDKLVHAIGSVRGCEPIEVMIYIIGSRPPTKEVVSILRPLWSHGIKTGILEGVLSVEDSAKEVGANLVVMLGEGGELRVRTWDHDRFQERHVTRPELISYILKTLRPESTPTDCIATQLNTSVTTVSSVKNIPSLASQNQNSGTASLDIIFLTSEKPNMSKKRRYENQVEHKISPVLAKFQRKEKISLIIVDLPSGPLRGLVGLIDPAECGAEQGSSSPNSIELQALIDRYPKYKHNIMQIYDEIVDIFGESKTLPVVGVYSVLDSFCRLIL